MWMRRPATFGSRQGLLLLEAVLAAVVIAVGLVFISRGLASQLKAVRTIDEQQTLLALAHGTLLSLEARLAAGHILDQSPEGGFEAPYQSYRWSATMEPRTDQTDALGSPLAGDVFVTVQRENPPASAVTLGAVWPNEWLAQ